MLTEQKARKLVLDTIVLTAAVQSSGIVILLPPPLALEPIWIVDSTETAESDGGTRKKKEKKAAHNPIRELATTTYLID